MNRAYEYLKKWVDCGNSSFDRFTRVWTIYLNANNSESGDELLFRQDIKALIEAAEKGGINKLFSDFSFFGTWPGDETDQELLAQLDDIRKQDRGSNERSI